MLKQVSNSKRQVNTLITSILHRLQKKCACEEKQTGRKERVFGTLQMLPVSHPVCCISVVSCGWCVAEWGVCFVFFCIYICVYVYAHVFVHTAQCVCDCVCLVEGFICWRASLPVAVVTTAWPSALSW